MREREPSGSFLVENNDRLKEILITLLKGDVKRSLEIDKNLKEHGCGVGATRLGRGEEQI